MDIDKPRSIHFFKRAIWFFVMSSAKHPYMGPRFSDTWGFHLGLWLVKIEKASRWQDILQTWKNVRSRDLMSIAYTVSVEHVGSFACSVYCPCSCQKHLLKLCNLLHFHPETPLLLCDFAITFMNYFAVTLFISHNHLSRNIQYMFPTKTSVVILDLKSTMVSMAVRYLYMSISTPCYVVMLNRFVSW